MGCRRSRSRPRLGPLPAELAVPAKRQPIVAAPHGGVTEAGKAGSAIADVAGARLRAGVVRGLGDVPGPVGGLFGGAGASVVWACFGEDVSPGVSTEYTIPRMVIRSTLCPPSAASYLLGTQASRRDPCPSVAPSPAAGRCLTIPLWSPPEVQRSPDAHPK